MIGLVDYAAGNLRSVEFALEALGVPSRRASQPAELADCGGIVLPGVGASSAAMAELRRRRFVEALRESPLPLLGICLGMQLLTELSEEGGRSVPCLGLVPGRTERIRRARRLPHVGWNRVRLHEDPIFAGLDPEEYFYFLHSYRVRVPRTHSIAECSYGERFPAALRVGSRVGVQFHPEKSGPAGLRILANFCRACGVAAPC